MHVNFIDPGLSARGGHHFDWCEKVARYLGERHACQLRIYTGRRITPDARRVLEKYGEVFPVFGMSPYARTKNEDPVSGKLTRFLDSALSLAAELRDIERADIWLWPTLFDYQLSALAMARVAAPVAACIHMPPDYSSASLGPAIWGHGAIAAQRAKLDIRFGTTTRELAGIFAPLIARTVDVMPLMVDAVAASSPKPVLKRIGFFGDQAPRKGSRLLPELVRKLYARGYDLVVHDSSSRIRGADAPRLRFLSYVENLSDEIARCDLVIVPYDPAFYRTMASGIAWEAVARGVPVLAPAATSPGRFVLDSKAGATFEKFDVESICKAVEQAGEHYSAIARGAFEASRDWSAHHGTRRFVDAMLARG